MGWLFFFLIFCCLYFRTATSRVICWNNFKTTGKVKALHLHPYPQRAFLLPSSNPFTPQKPFRPFHWSSNWKSTASPSRTLLQAMVHAQSIWLVSGHTECYMFWIWPLRSCFSFPHPWCLASPLSCTLWFDLHDSWVSSSSLSLSKISNGW